MAHTSSLDHPDHIKKLLVRQSSELAAPDPSKTNIKQQTLDIKQKTITTNKVSNSPLRGEELSTEVNLCEGPLGPEVKSLSSHCSLSEKVLGIGSTAHKPLTTSDIAYAALTLYRPKPKQRGVRHRVNLDFRIETSTTFNKLVFALTKKHSEFDTNLPPDWKNIPAYAQAWDLCSNIKSLDIPCWIGKGCIRQTYKKGRTLKSKMRLGTAMVLWEDQNGISGRCWLEQACFDFEFDQVVDSELFLAKSEPFDAQVTWDQSPWL